MHLTLVTFLALMTWLHFAPKALRAFHDRAYRVARQRRDAAFSRALDNVHAARLMWQYGELTQENFLDVQVAVCTRFNLSYGGLLLAIGQHAVERRNDSANRKEVSPQAFEQLLEVSHSYDGYGLAA